MIVGMLLATVALLGLAQMDVGTSYNAIWPFFVLLGAGIALTMPSPSALGMSAVDRTRPGIASGVINASRQVGGAIGIAVLGSIAAKLAVDNWLSSSAAPPAQPGPRAQDLVVGGQTGLVGQRPAPTPPPPRRTRSWRACRSRCTSPPSSASSPRAWPPPCSGCARPGARRGGARRAPVPAPPVEV